MADTLNFKSLRTGQDKLNFGEDDLDNLAVYYKDIPYPMGRYNRVWFTARIKPYEELTNHPRYFMVALYDDLGKIVSKALSSNITNEERVKDEVIAFKEAKPYTKARLIWLVEKYDDGPIGVEDMKVYLGEKI